MVPRRSSVRWIRSVDNQLCLTTGLLGLHYFSRPDPGGNSNSGGGPISFDSWPHLSMAMDRGSEGVASLHFLQRHLSLNIEEVFDLAHDSWRDFQRVLREASLLPMWYMYMIAANVLQGPWLESARYKALVECLTEVSLHFEPDSTPLYDQLLADMLWGSGRCTARRLLWRPGGLVWTSC